MLNVCVAASQAAGSVLFYTGFAIVVLQYCNIAIHVYDADTRTRALRLLAHDSVSRYVNEHEPEAMQRIQRVWQRDSLQRTTITAKAGWLPADNPDPEAFS